MYFRHLLRTRFIGTGAAQLNRLHLVCLSEVAVLKIFTSALIVINTLYSIAAATHLDNNDNTCVTSSGGGSGNSAVPRHQEVCFVVPPLA